MYEAVLYICYGNKIGLQNDKVWYKLDLGYVSLPFLVPFNIFCLLFIPFLDFA